MSINKKLFNIQKMIFIAFFTSLVYYYVVYEIIWEVKYLKQTFYLEFYGKQLDQAELVKAAKAIWTKSGQKASELTSLKLYVKPEENMVYYVFNEDETGSFSID